MAGTSYSKQASANILVYVALLLKSCKINDIWFNPILKILFEVYIEFYHDYKNVHCRIVL